MRDHKKRNAATIMHLIAVRGIHILVLLIAIAVLSPYGVYAHEVPPASHEAPDLTIRLAPSPGSLPEGESSTITGQFGFRIEYLPAPIPPRGYIFVGWFVNGNKIEAPVAAIRNTTLLAAYAPIVDPYEIDRYVVFFDPGLGFLPPGVSPVASHGYGTAITRLPIPTLEGYIFDGWTWHEEPILAPFIVRGEMVLEAVWVPVSQQLLFVPGYPLDIPPFHFVAAFNPFPGSFQGDETGVRLGRNSVTVREMPKDPIRNGAIFEGWMLPNGNILDDPHVIRGDITLTAIWYIPEDGVPHPSPSSPVESRQNPQTSPLAVSFLVFGAVAVFALAIVYILHMTRKQSAAEGKYRSAIARSVRESRLVIRNK